MSVLFALFTITANAHHSLFEQTDINLIRITNFMCTTSKKIYIVDTVLGQAKYVVIGGPFSEVEFHLGESAVDQGSELNNPTAGYKQYWSVGNHPVLG